MINKTQLCNKNSLCFDKEAIESLNIT